MQVPAEDGKTLAQLQSEHPLPPKGPIQDEETERSAFRNYVRDLILGFNDGVVSVYAIVAFVAGAAASTSAIAIAGVAGLAAGALSMGIGEYVSTKSQAQYYKAEAERERVHIHAYRALEVEELRGMLRAKDYPEPLIEPLVRHIVANEDRFVDFMMREEFGVGKEADRSPVAAMALVMAAFAVGASLPVLPYVLVPAGEPLALATALAVAGLFLAGAVKGRVSGLSPVRSGLEMAALGSLAALVTYGIGRAFGVTV